MNVISPNHAPAIGEIPSLSAVAQTAALLNIQASAAQPDSFPGFHTTYDHAESCAHFMIDRGPNLRTTISINGTRITCNETRPTIEQEALHGGVVKTITEYPLTLGSKITVMSLKGLPLEDGSLAPVSPPHLTERNQDEDTYYTLQQCLGEIVRREPPPAPESQRRSVLSRLLGWVLRGSIAR